MSSFRQRLLRSLYPTLMRLTQLTGKNNRKLINRDGVSPKISLTSIPFAQIDGKPFDWNAATGKWVLIANTASDCGYTGQYGELQTLQEMCADKLLVIGFPANDFKEQEKGNGEEIAAFCQRNYGVQFPLTKKAVVIKTAGQHPIWHWLTHKEENGWSDQAPDWNFSKYLIAPSGKLTHYFGPSVSPLASEVTEALKNQAA